MQQRSLWHAGPRVCSLSSVTVAASPLCCWHPHEWPTPGCLFTLSDRCRVAGCNNSYDHCICGQCWPPCVCSWCYAWGSFTGTAILLAVELNCPVFMCCGWVYVLLLGSQLMVVLRNGTWEHLCTCSRRLRMWSEVYTSDRTSAVLWKEGGGGCCADCLVDKFKWVLFKILYILFICTPYVPNYKLLCLF